MGMLARDPLQLSRLDKIENTEGEMPQAPAAYLLSDEESGKTRGANIGSQSQELARGAQFVQKSVGYRR